ncbi:MAG: hypothetical protein A2X86_05085 [Bdellovibrionales bacterium GWA2_49_15]|nr:MAG: hypothetical protein A2X86_05085 [Bdellovibrionales bacterium GWA2_49_15]
MPFEKKISFAKYLLLSCLPYLVGIGFEGSSRGVFAYTAIYICVVINQIMLIKGVNMMVDAAHSHERAIIVSLFICKAIILFLGISLGVHFIGNKVIIPVIFYIYQIFILVFSLKRI